MWQLLNATTVEEQNRILAAMRPDGSPGSTTNKPELVDEMKALRESMGGRRDAR